MNDDSEISDVVKTREVLIYNDANQIRMALDGRGVEPKICIYKEDGTPAIEISSMEMDSDSRRITLFGKAHKWRLSITCTTSGVGIVTFDQDGRIVKEWDLLGSDDKT
jgi:hypothetical protein